jgi:hypothetical protein
MPTYLHGQHGVAFVEPIQDPMNTTIHPDMHSMTLTANAGYGFDGFDLKLDIKNANQGGQNGGHGYFFAYDRNNNLISPIGMNSFSLSITGQNPFTGATTLGEVITKLVILTDTSPNAPIIDIKQVSANAVTLQDQPALLVPEPSSFVMFGATSLVLFGFAWRRRQAKMKRD